MEITRRNYLVYGLLAAVWALVLVWQVEEHVRLQVAAKADLRDRSKVIANTLGSIIRGMQFRGAVLAERLEPVLNEMISGRGTEPVKPSELIYVALLNATNEPVAEVGNRPDLQREDLQQTGEHWGRRSVTFVNPVSLGAGLTSEGITNTFIVPRRSELTNRVDEPGREFRRHGPPPEDPGASNGVAGAPPGPPPPPGNVGGPGGPERGPGGPPRMGEFRPRRPWWLRGMDPALIQSRSLHGLVLTMSTDALTAAVVHDLWLRAIIAGLATASVLGSGLAWRNLGKSSDLQLRLVRASEMNTHLKEMNLAAAGLAHETRNPLNIIRGLAQMISKQAEATAETREKSREIVEQADRVAAQLNEFINYSRPREVRRRVLPLTPVVNEVVRTLGYDLEEKKIQLQVTGDPLSIEADEQLLRQALFNLLLNAVQAVDGDGQIQVVAQRRTTAEAWLEVRDNGPGVRPECRAEIFKPYFTMQAKGTGLGLAVVQQIVLAHGWEIECLPNTPRGAVFRISHLKVAG